MTVVFPPAEDKPAVRYELAVETRPRRAFTSINVQFEANEVFDLLHAHHTARSGQRLREPDFFNVVLAAYLASLGGDLPAALRCVTGEAAVGSAEA